MLTNIRSRQGFGLLAAIAVLVLVPAVGMFILPAALIWVLGGFRSLDRFTRGVYCFLFGVSCWAWLPWLTRYLPVSFTTLVRAVVVGLGAIHVVLLLLSRRRSPQPIASRERRDAVVLGVVLTLTVLARMAPVAIPNVPPGADMSMHAYNARLVMDNDAIPKTHRPLLPIDSFGEYPIGFAVLTASTSLMSSMEVQRSALLWTGLSYVFLPLGLYLLLRAWFTPVISFGTAAVATFLAKAPQCYCEWGGNPTVLSFAFVMAALGSFFWLNRNDRFVELFAQASLWAAAFLTHTIPFLAVTYFLIVFALCFAVRAVVRRRLSELSASAKSCALVFMIALLLVSPFLAGYSTRVSDNEIEWSKTWQRDTPYGWHGNLGNALWTVPGYFCQVLGYHVFAVALLGLAVSSLTPRLRLCITLSVLLLAGLVINTQYWLLPFSYALYAGRVTILVLAPVALLSAGAVERLVRFSPNALIALRDALGLSRRVQLARGVAALCVLLTLAVVIARVASDLFEQQWLGSVRFVHVLPGVALLLLLQACLVGRNRRLGVAAAGLTAVLISAFLVVGFCWNHYYEWYWRYMSFEGCVSQDHLRAFEWIKQNSATADVILNIKDGDESALWIPAVCARRVLNPHWSPFYLDELTEGNRDAIPKFLFVGVGTSSPIGVGEYLARAGSSPYWRERALFGSVGIFESQPYLGRVDWEQVTSSPAGPIATPD